MASPSLERWAEKAGSRGALKFNVHSLVFGVGGLFYFVYRTRLQLINLAVRLLLHILEYYLIFHTMPAFLFKAMVLRVLGIALESGWWGALDSMRIRIRKLSEKGNISGIREEIEDWLAIALWLGAFVLAACVIATIFLDVVASRDMLVLAMGLQLAVRLALRTLYSGVYAIKRVYVRFEWIIAAEMFMFALAWLLYPYLKAWTLPLCLFASCALSSWISFHFIRRSLDFMRITPSLIAKPFRHSKLIVNHSLRSVLLPGLAMVATKLQDVVLIVVLQLTVGHDPKEKFLLFGTYLVIPAVRTAMGWAQIMYFDLARHHLDVFKNFRRNFELYGLTYAILYGYVIVVLMAAALMISLPVATRYIPIIGIYVVFSSILGFVQVGLFTRKKYSLLIALSLLQYTLLYTLGTHGLKVDEVFLLSLAIPAAIGWFLMSDSNEDYAENEHGYMQWTRSIAKRKDSVLLLSVKLIEGTNRGSRQHVAEQFTRIFGNQVVFCLHRGTFLLAFAGEYNIKRAELDELVKMAAGCIQHIKQYAAENGRQALMLINKNGLETGGELTAAILLELFNKTFPHGYVQIPTQKNAPFIRQADVIELPKIAGGAMAFVEGRKSPADTAWHVTAAQTDGVIETIFLIPKSSFDTEARAEWANIVRAYNRGDTSLRGGLQSVVVSPL